MIAKRLLVAAVLACLLSGCATSHHHNRRNSAHDIRTNYIVTVADDFIVDVYRNGVRVPDERRHLLAEIFGATVERVDLPVHRGDWLVFHVVNDRMRWGGCCYFAVAGVLQANEFGFVSETKSGRWTACDDPARAQRFVERKRFMQYKAQAPAQVWADGTPKMKQFAGESWNGEPIWGRSSDTWLKLIVE